MGEVQPHDHPGDSASTVTLCIHTHGLSARIVLIGDTDYGCILRKLDWSPRHRGWVRSEPRGGSRWQLRSSAWLTGRRASRSTGLGRRNVRWGTAIASLNVQRGKDGWALDIETVRRSDIPTLLGGVLDLEPEQWKVAYFRRLERFVCLASRDAYALAKFLDLRHEPVRGERDGDKRSFRKAHLVRPAEWMIPVTIRTRSRTNVEVALYQVANGATAGTWKLEARLQRKTNQLPFDEGDGQRALDQVLDNIIGKYDLDTISKPARWEPRSSIDSRRTVGDMAGLPMASWRGSEPAAGKFDTPLPAGAPFDDLCLVRSNGQSPQGFQPLGGRAVQGAPAGLGGISSHQRSDDALPQTGIENLYQEERGGSSRGNTRSGSGSTSSMPSPYRQLLSRRGSLVEIIHSKDDDPVFIADRVIEEMGTAGIIFSVSVLTSKTMASEIRRNLHISEWLVGHPLHPDVGTMADETWAPDLREHVLLIAVDERLLVRASVPVPLDAAGDLDVEAEAKIIEAMDFEADHRPLARRMQERLSSFFHGLRVMCERTGLRVVLLSPEARPVGQSQAADRDLRSLAGDAGRFYAHLRIYWPRGSRVVEVWKDEVEGLGTGWLRLGGSRPGGQLPSVESLGASLGSSEVPVQASAPSVDEDEQEGAGVVLSQAVA
jgi:hypothetical protein